MNAPVVAVLGGGISGEREVSLRSAAAVAEALSSASTVELFDVDSAKVPSELRPDRHVVLSTLHGTFGEDGGMQTLLEEAGFAYAGSDAEASRLCIDKDRTRRIASASGIPVARGLTFMADRPPRPSEVIKRLGSSLVLKPNDSGSSLGLSCIEGEDELAAAIERIDAGSWLIEERIIGRELTVGVLGGSAMGVVEIMPKSGRYDYASKYTSGLTRYEAPAAVPERITQRLRVYAEEIFSLTGCRDFARVDFMLGTDEKPVFLEINTLPGMTATSLLPKSASCVGLDFKALVCAMTKPACQRFLQQNPVLPS